MKIQLKNKQKLLKKKKELEEKNRELCKRYGKDCIEDWKKQPYGEYALIEAKLKGYKLAEEDLK